jgi:adenylosuccinate synthase
LNGTTSLALTGLAFLSGLDAINVCTEYRVDGDFLTVLPASPRVLAQAEPVYTKLSGFNVDVGTLRSVADLPREALSLVEFIENQVNVPVGAVCVGKEREQLLIRET